MIIREKRQWNTIKHQIYRTPFALRPLFHLKAVGKRPTFFASDFCVIQRDISGNCATSSEMVRSLTAWNTSLYAAGNGSVAMLALFCFGLYRDFDIDRLEKMAFTVNIVGQDMLTATAADSARTTH